MPRASIVSAFVMEVGHTSGPLRPSNAVEAAGVVARVAETIRLLERGRLEMPADADPGMFIMSDGKQTKKIVSTRGCTLDELLSTYKQSIPVGAKAETTLKTEELHIAHLLQGLKKSKLAQDVTTAEMQRYVEKRLHDTYRERAIRPRLSGRKSPPSGRFGIGRLRSATSSALPRRKGSNTRRQSRSRRS